MRSTSTVGPSTACAAFPVRTVGTARGLTTRDKAWIVSDYLVRGFALLQFGGEHVHPAEQLVALGSALGLGRPYVPPLYQGPETTHLYSTGVNVVQAPSQASPASHPAFESREPLALHTDGTLNEIASIRTSALLCEVPAHQGGETIIFQAARAFTDLLARRPAAARALLDPRALTRKATVNGSRATNVGPVIALRSGNVVARYCDTPRDIWAFDLVAHLEEAYDAMAEYAGNPAYCFRVRLEERQCVLMANDKVSHGRTGYEHSPTVTRRLWRALFVGRPRLDQART